MATSQMRRGGSFARRCGASLLAVLFGGAVGYLPFLLLTIQADGHGRTSFALVLGVFCLAGWLLVGLPIAATGLAFASTTLRTVAMLGSGLAGIALVALVFQGMTLLVAVLAFIPAAASMFFYLRLRQAFDA
jgi:hypothetical protein